MQIAFVYTAREARKKRGRVSRFERIVLDKNELLALHVACGPIFYDASDDALYGGQVKE